MSEENNEQIMTIGAGLLGFLAVVAVGGLALFHHAASMKAPPPMAYAPVDVAPAFAPAAAAVAARASRVSAAVSSPAPMFSRSETAAQSAEAPAAVAAPSAKHAAAGAPKLAVTRHLGTGGSASSSASASVASAPQEKNASAKKKALVAPKLDLSKNQGALASSVHYGVSSRAELMGRAAGPVYNFSGKGSGQGAQAGAVDGNSTASEDASQGVDAAQQQVDSSDMSPEQKAAVTQSLNQARQTIQSGQ